MYKKTWWINPLAAYSLVMLVVIGAAMFSSEKYMSIYGAHKQINWIYFLLYLINYCLFAVGYKLSMKTKTKIERKISLIFSEDFVSYRTLKKTYKIMMILCFLAYGIWYINFIRIHGLAAFRAIRSPAYLSSMMYVFKNNSGRVGGITSFTEIGIIAIPLGIYLIFNEKNKKTRNNYILSMSMLFFLSVIRAFLFSERIALIELMVPAVISYLSNKKGRKKSRIISLAPVIGVVVLVLVFGVMEYSRSWLRFYSSVYNSYFEFLQSRLLGYYYNAINTECLIIEHMKRFPYFSIEWFWRLPKMSTIQNFLYGGNINVVYSQLIREYSHPDYTNPGGLLSFYKDYGMGFMFFQIVFGYIIGRTYKLFLKGNVFAVVLYAYIYVAIIELPRYFMFGHTRSLAVYMGLYILYRITRRGTPKTNNITAYTCNKHLIENVNYAR